MTDFQKDVHDFVLGAGLQALPFFSPEVEIKSRAFPSDNALMLISHAAVAYDRSLNVKILSPIESTYASGLMSIPRSLQVDHVRHSLALRAGPTVWSRLRAILIAIYS